MFRKFLNDGRLIAIVLPCFISYEKKERFPYKCVGNVVIILITLINAIKVEHTRLSHTIQFIWLLYALSTIIVRQEDSIDSPDTVPDPGLTK